MKTQKHHSNFFSILFFSLISYTSQSQIALNWAHSDGNATVSANSIATDASNNTWVSALGDDGGDNQLILFKYNSSGTASFAPIYVSNAVPRGIVTDASDNLIVTGHFSGTSVFGSYSLTSVGTADAFIAKYNSNGVIQYVLQMRGTSSSSAVTPLGISINGSDIFIAGAYSETIDFDPDINTQNQTSVGGYDIFIAKYTGPDCEFDWAKSMGGSGFEWANSIAVDVSGTVYITGFFEGTVDFDPSGNISNQTSAGGLDIFVARYAANGLLFWVKAIGGSGDDEGRKILVDGNHVYVTGSFTGTADFDPNGNVSNQTSAGGQDIFLADYSAASGAYNWAYNLGGTGDDVGYGLSLDNSGNIYTTGWFSGIGNFNPSGTETNTSAGLTDIYIAKYNSTGDYQWAQRLGGTGTDRGLCILHSSDKLYSVGSFENTVDFDPTGSTSNLISTGLTDAFVAEFEDNSTGIESNELNRVQVYPNPANSTLFIETDNLKTIYQLQDLTGKILLNGNVTATRFNLDISTLIKGIYLLSLFDGEQQVHRKVVKE